MKYLAVLVVLGIIYFVVARSSPVKEVERAPAQPLLASSPAPSVDKSNVLKRPIDRTRAVLDQASERNKGGEF
ncbi:MAG: hypothetical protein M3463_13300 [Verrucomicrobiota bacterium]|nr:hypothetical protein [Verrucomicrobiota bacterium]